MFNATVHENCFELGGLVYFDTPYGRSATPAADSGFRRACLCAMQIQENAAARKVIVFAWVRGIEFRTEPAGVSSWTRIRAGRTALSMRRFLLSTREGFDDCEGQAIPPAQRSWQASADHWWMGAAFCSNLFLLVSNLARDCVIGDGCVAMRLGRVVQSVPYNDSHKSQKAYCAVSSSPFTKKRSRLCQTSSRLRPRPTSSILKVGTNCAFAQQDSAD